MISEYSSKVAILMATYNGADYISEQINSIVEQSCEDWILYIHDDNSTDETVNIIEFFANAYKDKIVFFRDDFRSGGPAENFLYLLNKVPDSNYFMFCDQDDVWLSNKIELTLQQINKLEAINNDVPLLVFSNLKVVDEKLNVISNSMWEFQCLNPNNVLKLNHVLGENVVTGCTMMINEKMRDLSLYMNTDYFMHDHWIAIHACRSGSISFISEPLTLYRQHPLNQVGTNKNELTGKILKLNRHRNLFKRYFEKYKYIGFEVSYAKIAFFKGVSTFLCLLK